MDNMDNNVVDPQAEDQNEEVNAAVNEMPAQEEAVCENGGNESASAPVCQESLEAPVEETSSAPVDLEKAREEATNRYAELPEDLQAELDAAMGGADVNALLEAGTVLAADLEVGTKVTGKIIQVGAEEVFVELPGNVQAFIPVKQYGENLPEVGAEVKAKVAKEPNADGLYELTLPGAAQDVADWSQVEKGMIVETTITAFNSGGLECRVNRLRGFIPASQIANYRVENLEELVGQKMECLITEVNPQKRNLVLSRRAILDRQRDAQRDELIQKLAPGQIYDGVVRKIMDFGAFVDIGGIDGLLHISQLSWDRVKHPSDVLTEGQEIRVQVEKIDPRTKKISFAYRDMMENPWTNVAADFQIGQEVEGTVTKITPFGAFIGLKPGVEGLVHISEISHQRIGKVSDVLNIGDKVTAKILNVDPSARRISLSVKAMTEAPPKKEGDAKTEKKVSEEYIPGNRPRAVNAPLRGGVGGDLSGGFFAK